MVLYCLVCKTSGDCQSKTGGRSPRTLSGAPNSATRRADRLIAAWRRQQRRSRAIDALREAAIEAGERDRPIPLFDPVTGEGMMTMEWVKQASDEDLITYIKRKTGESD
ncbi:MAG: hypothetical protein AAFO63_01440 [Pseudomonadota bacterium]